MEETKPQAWLRYFDYKDMMTEKARLEGQDVEDLVAFNDDVRDWATREYPQKSQICIAHLADYVTWDRFFDPRDNPVKAPHKYIRKDGATAEGEKEIRVTEPYTSVERQMVVAFSECFPKTPLLTFYSYHDSFESEFAARLDPSNAEKKWGAEKATWTHFWTSPRLQEEFPFPGTQPKVITDGMVRRRVVVPKRTKKPTKEHEPVRSGTLLKQSFPIEIAALIAGGDVQKSREQDEHRNEKQHREDITTSTLANDKAPTNSKNKGHKRKRRQLAPSPHGRPDPKGARRNKRFGIENNLPVADNTTNSNGSSHVSHSIGKSNRVQDLQDPYHETRPRGAAHVSQMPSLLAREAEIAAKSKEMKLGTIQRVYNFRLSTYVKDPMHNDKTIGELQAFAQSDAFNALDKYGKQEGLNDQPPRAKKRKRDVESSSDSEEGDTDDDEVVDFTANLDDSSTFGTPHNRLKHKDMGGNMGPDEEDKRCDQSLQQYNEFGSRNHGYSFRQCDQVRHSSWDLPLGPPGEGERIPALGTGGAAASKHSLFGGLVDPDDENGGLRENLQEDKVLALPTNVPDFTFKDTSKEGKPGRKQKQSLEPTSDPYHDTRPVVSLAAPVRPDPFDSLRARANEFAATFPNFKPNSIKTVYSRILRKLRRDPSRQHLTIRALESLAVEKTHNKCDTSFTRASQLNPPQKITKNDKSFFHFEVPDKGKKPPKKKRRSGREDSE